MSVISKELKNLIEKNTLILATSYKDKPHCIAIGDAKVIDEDNLIITDNFMKETIKNIKKNKNISLIFWKGNAYELRGIARYLTKGKWLDFVKKMPENKRLPAKGAILVNVKKIKKSV
jgi:predicted pyridoxine 5'-phosphate oxidase superfamily flavin-nucleotide-binding protein